MKLIDLYPDQHQTLFLISEETPEGEMFLIVGSPELERPFVFADFWVMFNRWNEVSERVLRLSDVEGVKS